MKEEEVEELAAAPAWKLPPGVGVIASHKEGAVKRRLVDDVARSFVVINGLVASSHNDIMSS
eukprot:CAMPEP_0171334052 /NCGR_PEP_ID=MMETSP0878-20121228/4414_1 /TAXON_ID=67004 /ORGANISM="Thalassiosira weissflogii, Strain CCMP1336" /LENGTH=61 /DNA_ID=CAMNT_0011835089 /DNA_START=36 /DNA_END=222 /DNA_ORIENTATION=-